MYAQLPPLEQRTVVNVLTSAASEQPDATAVRDRTRVLTYQQLLDEARALAGGLDALGVHAGQAVLMLLDNHVDFVVTWLGTSLLGAVEVPINTAYKGQVLAHLVRDSGATVLIVERAYASLIDDIIDQIPSLQTVVVRGDSRGLSMNSSLRIVPFESVATSEPVPVTTPAPSDIMAIMYTSGTTGRAKGVHVTHAHAYGYCSPALYGAASPDDVVLVVLPLFHIGGQWAGVYNAFVARAECVILDRFHASTYWDSVREFGCTYTLLLGAMASFLLNRPELIDDRAVPLRRALMVPAIPQVHEFSTRFDCQVATAYGSTEASTPFYTQFGDARYGTCGTLRPDFEARLVDENDCEVPAGATGELVLRAREPWVLMAGYHGNPTATVDAWRNQWLHTGDAFTVTPDGEFRFADRIKDALRRRGENISSFEVESGANQHPDVVESAAIGVRSEHSEEEILLFVTLSPESDLTPAELAFFMAGNLPKFMVPRYIEFIRELPRTSTQKIMKSDLRSRGISVSTWDSNDANHVFADAQKT